MKSASRGERSRLRSSSRWADGYRANHFLDGAHLSKVASCGSVQIREVRLCVCRSFLHPIGRCRCRTRTWWRKCWTLAPTTATAATAPASQSTARPRRLSSPARRGPPGRTSNGAQVPYLHWPRRRPAVLPTRRRLGCPEGALLLQFTGDRGRDVRQLPAQQHQDIVERDDPGGRPPCRRWGVAALRAHASPGSRPKTLGDTDGMQRGANELVTVAVWGRAPRRSSTPGPRSVMIPSGVPRLRR